MNLRHASHLASWHTIQVRPRLTSQIVSDEGPFWVFDKLHLIIFGAVALMDLD